MAPPCATLDRGGLTQWGQGGVGSGFQFSVNVNEWLDGQEVYLSFDGPAPLSLESCWDAEIVRQGRGAAGEAQLAFRLAATPPEGGASFG